MRNASSVLSSSAGNINHESTGQSRNSPNLLKQSEDLIEVHFYNLEPIIKELKYLQNQHAAVKESLLNELKTIYYKELINHGRIFENESNMAEQTLKSLISQERTKSGLINGLGTIIESISENSDANDAVHYETALRTLQHNRKKIVTNLNADISSTGNVIEKFNETNYHTSTESRNNCFPV